MVTDNSLTPVNFKVQADIYAQYKLAIKKSGRTLQYMNTKLFEQVIQNYVKEGTPE